MSDVSLSSGKLWEAWKHFIEKYKFFNSQDTACDSNKLKVLWPRGTIIQDKHQRMLAQSLPGCRFICRLLTLIYPDLYRCGGDGDQTKWNTTEPYFLWYTGICFLCILWLLERKYEGFVSKPIRSSQMEAPYTGTCRRYTVLPLR